jgi:hypothetical protein
MYIWENIIIPLNYWLLSYKYLKIFRLNNNILLK